MIRIMMKKREGKK